MKRDNKNILVVGADSDIGSAFVTSSLDKQCVVIGTGLQETPPNTLAYAQQHTTFQYLRLNILDFDSVEFFWKSIEKLEKFDWIVYFPGLIDQDERSKLDDAQYIRNAFVINAIFPMMLAERIRGRINPGGGIIFISSTSALAPNGFFPIYSASKASLNAFAIALKHYWVDTHATLHVYAVCPGPTNTSMRELIAKDAKTHQNPEVIVSLLHRVIEHSDEFPYTIYKIRDGKTETIM